MISLSNTCASGESLSVAVVGGRKWVVVTPLSLPGERIRARVYRHARLHSHADLLDVLEANTDWRDMSRVQCRYFGKCAGCQYQVCVSPSVAANRRLIRLKMLSYEKQLELKRNTVVEAYRNYSGS